MASKVVGLCGKDTLAKVFGDFSLLPVEIFEGAKINKNWP